MKRDLVDVPAVDRGNAFDHFGREENGWDLGEGDDGEAIVDGDGAPGRVLIASALNAFADCWGDFDPETAARIFNLPLAMIEEAAAGYVLPPFESDPLDVTLTDLGTAIQVLTGCRSHFGSEDVALIAKLLNQPWTRIVEAVGGHYWMFIQGHGDDPAKLYIEHEGE